MKALRNLKEPKMHCDGLNNHWFARLLLFMVIPLITGVSLKAYNPYISGPTLICSSGQYTVEDLPPGASIVWSTEGHAQLSSSQGSNPATFSIDGNGIGKVKATIYCCGNPSYWPELNIWAGPPILLYLSAETYEYGYAGNSYSFAAWPYYSIAEGEATWYTDPYAYVWYNEENYAIIYFENAGSYYISAEVTNTCGSSGVVDLESWWPWIIYP